VDQIQVQLQLKGEVLKMRSMFRDKSGDFFLLELSTNFWIRDITFFCILLIVVRIACILVVI
jgi:hypothetical protein